MRGYSLGSLNRAPFFPGQPVRLDFEVLYQPVAGRWRLHGLSVRPTVSVPPPTAVVARSRKRRSRRRSRGPFREPSNRSVVPARALRAIPPTALRGGLAGSLGL